MSRIFPSVGDKVRSTFTGLDCSAGTDYMVHAVFASNAVEIVDDVGQPNVLSEDEYVFPIPDTPAPTGYPDGNPKTAIGLTKPPLSVIPPVALIELGQAMKDGKAKYGLMNWRQHNVSSSVYFDAAMRHLLAWYDGEDVAADSGVHHLSHAMACLAILSDARHQGTLNDDRPIPGPVSAVIKKLTEAA